MDNFNNFNNLKLTLLILVILLVGVVYYILKYKKAKENFQASLVRLSGTDKCNFVPWGQSRQGCINRCMSDDKLFWGGDSCDLPNCRKLCDECEEPNRCRWQKRETRLAPIIKEQMPPKLELRVVSGEGEAIAFWENINNDNNKNTSFIIKWYKTYVPNDGVNVDTIEIEDPDKRNYKYVIGGLQNNETYSVVVFCSNTNSISDPSNVVLVKPTQNETILMPSAPSNSN